VPKKLQKINDYLFTDTNKTNEIQMGVNEMRVNDSKMRMRTKLGQ